MPDNNDVELFVQGTQDELLFKAVKQESKDATRAEALAVEDGHVFDGTLNFFLA